MRNWWGALDDFYLCLSFCVGRPRVPSPRRQLQESLQRRRYRRCRKPTLCGARVRGDTEFFGCCSTFMPHDHGSGSWLGRRTWRRQILVFDSALVALTHRGRSHGRPVIPVTASFSSKGALQQFPGSSHPGKNKPEAVVVREDCATYASRLFCEVTYNRREVRSWQTDFSSSS